jgi:hypothetical protein
MGKAGKEFNHIERTERKEVDKKKGMDFLPRMARITQMGKKGLTLIFNRSERRKRRRCGQEF